MPDVVVDQLPLDFAGDEWAAVMEQYYPLVLREAWNDAQDELGIALAFDLDNPLVQEVLDELAQQVTRIAETTRAEIQALVGRQADEGWSLARLADEIEALGAEISQQRAYMIAATETADAYTRGSLLAYEQSGVVVEVEWLVTQPCLTCSPLAGQTVKLGKRFDNGQGWSGYGPPVHPFCRCAVSPIAA